MFKFRRILACLATLPLALAAAPTQAQVIFTSNFDSVPVPAGGYQIFASVDGWTTTAGGGIEVQNHAAGDPFSETNLVELDSTSNSTMQRSIVDAGSYYLNFYYSPRPGIPLSSNGIDVLVNGVSIFNISGAGAGATVWSPQQLFFTVGAGSTLAFAAIGTSDSLGGYLDSISLVSAVPEPSAWGMMLLGFGAIGFAMRRRRSERRGLQVA